jgi:hypothetical protein
MSWIFLLMILLTLDVAHMKRPEKSSETVQCFQQTCCLKNSVTLKEESDKNAKVASYEEHLTMKLFTMYITWRFKVEESQQL